jgi:hypothetical protein
MRPNHRAAPINNPQHKADTTIENDRFGPQNQRDMFLIPPDPIADAGMEPAATPTPGKPYVPPVGVPGIPPERDLRLDLFRGVALWLIFLDHIPINIVSWVTIRNYGFSDAAEIFIFISGYTAAFVYGRSMRERGFVVSSARILKRAWQVYVAHIFLFAIYMAEIAYVTGSFENPLFAEEMNALDFLKNPDVTIIQALLLKFKPANMDVLPLYIVLLLLFPPILWLLIRNAVVALAASLLLYSLAWHLGWNIPSYPTGHWWFNPFAWQLLFVFGAWCALGGAQRLAPVLASPITLWIAIGYLVFALAIVMTWHFPRIAFLMPRWLSEWMYPIDKVHFIPVDWPGLKSRWARPAIVCGQHSLEIFCLGVFLAFAAHFVVIQFYGGVFAQIALSITGVAIMIGVASLLAWYKTMESRGGPPKRAPDSDLAGGSA